MTDALTKQLAELDVRVHKMDSTETLIGIVEVVLVLALARPVSRKNPRPEHSNKKETFIIQWHIQRLERGLPSLSVSADWEPSTMQGWVPGGYKPRVLCPGPVSELGPRALGAWADPGFVPEGFDPSGGRRLSDRKNIHYESVVSLEGLLSHCSLLSNFDQDCNTLHGNV